jgi:hypothetical protein
MLDNIKHHNKELRDKLIATEQDSYKQQLNFNEEKAQLIRDMKELEIRYHQLNEDLKLYQENSSELHQALSLLQPTATQEASPLALDIQSRPLSKRSSYKGNLYD